MGEGREVLVEVGVRRTHPRTHHHVGGAAVVGVEVDDARDLALHIEQRFGVDEQPAQLALRGAQAHGLVA